MVFLLISEPQNRNLGKECVPENPSHWFNKFLKIFNMGSISSKKHEMELGFFSSIKILLTDLCSYMGASCESKVNQSSIGCFFGGSSIRFVLRIISSQ